MILSNQIECIACGDKPYSTHRHDFKYCKCGLIAVDGGMDYLRRLGNPNYYIEMSIQVENDAIRAMIDALEWCTEYHRNDMGRIYAIARYLRDVGYEITKKGRP